LLDSVGRVLSEYVITAVDMPQWDNSAMDGFAVRADDCRQTATLKIMGYIPAGGVADGLLVRPGTAIKIMTGAPVPAGCTAIVPIEETIEEGDVVQINGPVNIRDHISFQGEDIKAGEKILSAGTVIRPPEVNLCASLGKIYLAVFRKPKVAILSTGDELVEPGETTGQGQIVNSNAFSLAASVKELGAEPLLLGIARDTKQSLQHKIQQGLNADVLITSAGVSAGDRDFVRIVLEELGVHQLFWKINIKPGRPTAFGLKDNKPVFSLPGNPVSTMVTFEEFVRPALLKMMGHKHVIKPTIKARLKEATKKKGGRAQFLRVKVTKDCSGLTATSAGDQNTGIVRTMIDANAIAFLPEDRTSIDAGEYVEVHLIDSFENMSLFE
ncbi:MAG: molybdopterin molybdotransferase MoeA, partial [Deltaproteobacteria bacterium]|nr:molybdopterin molybdotransferase MoeA [Deltaproteobacteria bacterium]